MTLTLNRLDRAELQVIAGSLGAALVLGLLVAWNPFAGVALLLALIYGALALVNLPLAMALWVPLLFLEGLGGATMLPEAGGSVIALAWIGQAVHADSWQRRQLKRHRRTITLAGIFVLWLGLSLLWAKEPGRGISLLISSVEVLVFMVLVATTPSNSRELRLVAGGFVCGALISALVGILGQTIGLANVEFEGRLQGAAGDPNFFAAQMVAGIAIALGLIATTRSARVRLGFGLAVLPLAYGIVASESRGGFVALIATAIAALIVFRHQRGRILLIVVGICAVVGLWLSTNTSALHRITSASADRGSGREDLWTIAERIYSDHNPLIGVGLSNFESYASQYTREPGTLTGVIHIETELGVHNAYLSLLTETGAIGVALFLLVVGVAVMREIRSAQRFEALGDYRDAVLNRALAVAFLGMLSAAFFLSNAQDKRIWVLMGLGLAAVSISAERAQERARTSEITAKSAAR